MASAADAAMERYAAGDAAAFEVLYDALGPVLFRYLRRRTPSEELARDLLQETMLHLHRARGTFLPGAPVLPWAHAIARRLLCDAHRAAGRQVPLFELEEADEPADPGGVSPEALVAACQACDRLDAALGVLPETQRRAFALVRLEGTPTREAAGRLGITVTALKLRVHRAYETLRRTLKDEA